MNNPFLYTVAPQLSFTHKLAEHVLSLYGEQPETLSEVILLLPSRRAIRTMRDAFLEVSGGKALLLPQMEGLGDIDFTFLLRHCQLTDKEINQLHAMEASVSTTQRLLLLSELIWDYNLRKSSHHILSHHSQAVEVAASLIAFLDDMERELSDWVRLDSIVPEEYAEYWQQTLHFLRVFQQEWPAILTKKGLCDPWNKRNQLLFMLAESWQLFPPKVPVIVAGATGTVPATARLMTVIAGLPKGSLYLPGFNDDGWEGEEQKLPETHPQYGVWSLLRNSGFNAKEVALLGGEHRSEREKWLNMAFLPSEHIDKWQSEALDSAAALKGCYLLECEHSEQEALVIAMLLREALETDGKTAALVTSNRALGRRVRNQLKRWGVEIDDSAGEPILHTPPAIFLTLIWEVVQSNFSPVRLLSLLKHPLLRMGKEPAEIRPLVRRLEKKALRGIQPANEDAILRKTSEDSELTAFIHSLHDAFSPLMDCFSKAEVTFVELLEIHIRVAEQLSQTLDGQPMLWHGEAAAQLSDQLREIREFSSDYPTIPAYDYGNIFSAILRPQLFRSQWGKHPRLHILSPMESRLQMFDRVILADLNEGGWPAVHQVDPWMSRPMKSEMGLPLPERRIGVVAHDFTQMACAKEVFLTRSEKQEGTVTVPSRFLLRMQAVMEIHANKEMLRQWRTHPVLQWGKVLDAPEKKITLPAVQPRPPVSARPRELSVTRIELLMRDPYSIYAQKILRLKKLEELEKAPSALEFGNAVHDALEQWSKKGDLTLQRLLQEGRNAFSSYQPALVVDALWWPRFEGIAEWIMQQPLPENSIVEEKGEWRFELSQGVFVVKARLDRMDIAPNGLTLVDYKTGSPPMAKDMKLKLSNQLLLTAVMVKVGGFGARVSGLPVKGLEYWKLSGHKELGKVVSVALDEGESLEEAIAEAEAKIKILLERFDNESTAYFPCPDWVSRPKYNDYEHLSRIAEWSAT